MNNRKLITTNQHGGLGTPVTLLTNIYKLKFSKHVKIYQYDLKIVGNYPETSRKFCWELFRELKLPPKIIYDGKKNIYSSDGTPRNHQKKIKINNRDLEVTISGPVSFVSVKVLLDSLNNPQSSIPLDTITVLNLALAQNLEMNRGFVNVKRNFFEEQPGEELSGGLRLWSGMSTSVIPTEGWGIVVRTLKTNAVFCQNGSLIDFVKNLLDFRDRIPKTLRSDQISKLKVLLRHLRVTTNHLSRVRRYTIRSIGRSAVKETLDNDPTTIQVYFRSTYKINLKYPELPCIEVGGGERKSYIPMELCEMVPNQPFYKNLDDKQKRNMIRYACEKPQDKFRSVEQMKNKLIQETGQFTKEHYGFSVDTQAMKVHGRILPSPEIEAGDKQGKPEQVDGGVWRLQKVKKPYSQPGKSRKLHFISLARSTNNLADFKLMLEKKAGMMGIEFHCDGRIIKTTEVGLYKEIEQIKSKDLNSYVFVILDSDSSYGNVKNCEMLGIPTQCIKLQTVRKVCDKNDQATLSNILLKYNSKLLGINWTIKVTGLPQNVFSAPVLILGADVTHFKRGENKPSIAAVVGSMDKDMAKFAFRVTAQYPDGDRVSDETIHDLKEMVKGILIDFNQATKAKPIRIIYYRDGVSEGQFENTVLEELGAIQDACSSLHPDYKPNISFIVCTKRNKQRFAVLKGQRKENLEPGTVVDKDVVAPKRFNFYLNSHKAIQGTSVPCHYYILYDDNKFNADAWQMLTYYLCHTYSRCTRTVSYPAPIYYAHLACFSSRSRMLAKYLDHDWDNIQPSLEDLSKIIKPPIKMFFI